MSVLGDVCIIEMGQSPKGETYNTSGNGIPLLNGPTEFGAFHPTPKLWTTSPTKVCNKGDLLFCVRGSTTGRMNWADREYCIGRGVGAFRAKSERQQDTRFIYFTLTYELERLLSLCSGSVFPNLSRNDFERFEIKWPEQSERKAIAEILGSLDDKIEANERMNETFEAMARAIFKSWFVDFDPVHAKAAGRKPHSMDSATAALFPDSFVGSPLGKIPKGWKVVPLPEAIEVNPARSLSKNTVAPYVDMQNMPTTGHRPIAWIDRPFGSGMRFMNGDTLVARITPCLENGKTAFVDFLPEGQIAWGSTEYIVLRPKPPLPAEFGYYLARSDEFRAFAISNMTGSSGRQRVPADCLSNYLMAVPTKEVAAAFGNIVRPLMREIASNDNQSRSLAGIRDIILPKLLSGEIRAEK